MQDREFQRLAVKLRATQDQKTEILKDMTKMIAQQGRLTEISSYLEDSANRLRTLGWIANWSVEDLALLFAVHGFREMTLAISGTESHG